MLNAGRTPWSSSSSWTGAGSRQSNYWSSRQRIKVKRGAKGAKQGVKEADCYDERRVELWKRSWEQVEVEAEKLERERSWEQARKQARKQAQE